MILKGDDEEEVEDNENIEFDEERKGPLTMRPKIIDEITKNIMNGKGLGNFKNYKCKSISE